jgi:hypothetical protein
MPTILVKAFITSTVATIASFGADNTLGTWKLNVEKSTRNPVRSVTMVREAVAGGVKVTTTGEGSNGTAINFTYSAKYDGNEYPVVGTGAPFDTISIKQVDTNTLIDERKKTGSPFHVTVPSVVSKDGKRLTTTAKGIDANGKPLSNT